MASFHELPKGVWWVAGASLVNRMGAMVLPFLVLYFTRSMHLSLKTATDIAACWGVGSLLAGPVGGYAADRIDPIRLMALSLGGSGVLMLLFPTVGGIAALMAATFGLALLTDLSRPSTMTALARLGGTEHGRNAFALNYLAINLGMSIGPLLGGFLAEVDYRYLFWIDGTTSLAAALLLLVSGATCPPQPRTEVKSDWNIGPTAFRLYFWLGLSFWVFMTFFSAGPVYAVEELHLRERDCGYIWLLNTVLIVFTSLWVSRVTEGRRLAALLTWAALSMVASYACLWFWPSLGGLIVGTLFLTIGEMLLFSNANAYVAQIVPSQKMGRAMGINAICVSLAVAMSSKTVGYFFTSQSSDRLWLVMASGGLIAALGFWSLPDPPREEPSGPS